MYTVVHVHGACTVDCGSNCRCNSGGSLAFPQVLLFDQTRSLHRWERSNRRLSSDVKESRIRDRFIFGAAL
jgi:hypothetical protein